MPFGSAQFEFSEVLRLQESLCCEQSSPLDNLTDEKLQFINLANRTFGFNGWSYNITKQEIDYVDSFNTVKVGVSCFLKVTLKDGTFREDLGYGTAEARNRGQAIEMASNIASSEALKETLKVFGIIFQNFDAESKRCSSYLPNADLCHRNQNDRFASGHFSNPSTSDGEEQNITAQCLQSSSNSTKNFQRPIYHRSKKFKRSAEMMSNSDGEEQNITAQCLQSSSNSANNFQRPIYHRSKKFKHSAAMAKNSEKSNVVEETPTLEKSSTLFVEIHRPEQSSSIVYEKSSEEGDPNYCARLMPEKCLQNELVLENDHVSYTEVPSNSEISLVTASFPLKKDEDAKIDHTPPQLLSVKTFKFLTYLSNRTKNRTLYLY